MPVMKLYAAQGYSLKASYPTGQTRQQLLYPVESLASKAYAWQFVGAVSMIFRPDGWFEPDLRTDSVCDL